MTPTIKLPNTIRNAKKKMATKLGRILLAIVGSSLPNEVRLSWGAVLCRSQTECYNRKQGAVSFRRVLGAALVDALSSTATAPYRLSAASPFLTSS